MYFLLVRSWFGRLLNSNLLATVGASIGSGVLLYLDIFGGDNSWVEEHPELVFRFFIGMLGTAAVFSLLRLAGNWASGRADDEGSSINELLVSVGRIVQRKSNRFRDALPHLSNRSPFEMITKPEDQIECILDEANDYFRRQRGITTGQLDVTVLNFDRKLQRWEFIFFSDRNKNRVDASELMEGKSTAAEAHRTGRRQFFASKNLAKKREAYIHSLNDKKDGSIFCEPVNVQTAFGPESFVVTFATYDSTLCDPNNPTQREAIEFILSEFCRRIELELLLWTIKRGKLNSRKIPKRKSR